MIVIVAITQELGCGYTCRSIGWYATEYVNLTGLPNSNLHLASMAQSAVFIDESSPWHQLHTLSRDRPTKVVMV